MHIVRYRDKRFAQKETFKFFHKLQEVNTNTVKALITSMMKDNKMSMGSIPRGVTYTQLNTVKIDGQ